MIFFAYGYYMQSVYRRMYQICKIVACCDFEMQNAEKCVKTIYSEKIYYDKLIAESVIWYSFFKSLPKFAIIRLTLEW